MACINVTLVALILTITITSVICAPSPDKKERFIIHVPVRYHTIHHYVVKKIPVIHHIDHHDYHHHHHHHPNHHDFHHDYHHDYHDEHY